jgi:hypothetical protein
MYKANLDVQTTIATVEHNDPESRARYIRHLTRQLKEQKVNSNTYLLYNTLINNFWVEQITQY